MKITLLKYQIVLIIIVLAVIAAGTVIYLNRSQGNFLSSQEAGEKAIAFINQSIEENVTASLLEVIEEGLIYKIRLQIEGTEYESYITKDGEFLFPSGFRLTEQQQTAQQETETETEEPAPANLADFAQCLTDKGMKFYGSKYCGWCQKQKEMFGDSLQYIAYVECIDEETDQWSQDCRDAQIDAVPTWQLPNGEMNAGYKTFEKLSELSGCPLE
jgi:hypothetical protein